jgi:hypothetical protein
MLQYRIYSKQIGSGTLVYCPRLLLIIAAGCYGGMACVFRSSPPQTPHGAVAPLGGRGPCVLWKILQRIC